MWGRIRVRLRHDRITGSRRELSRVVAGETVLLPGATGSVGAYAVQLVRQAGIRTMSTAIASGHAYVLELGGVMAVVH